MEEIKYIDIRDSFGKLDVIIITSKNYYWFDTKDKTNECISEELAGLITFDDEYTRLQFKCKIEEQLAEVRKQCPSPKP